MALRPKLTIEITSDITQFERNARQISKTLARNSKEIQQLGKNISSVFKMMMLRVAGAVQAAMKVRDAFKTIRAGTGATGEKPRALQDEFKKFARTVPESYGEAATAIADLNTGPGLSGQSLRKTGRAMPDVTGSIKLPEGVALVMPGDNSPFEVELMAPVAMNEQLRFVFREGGHTVGAGVVLQSLH